MSASTRGGPIIFGVTKENEAAVEGFPPYAWAASSSSCNLDGARRELQGEVVARKGDGTPWDHVTEVREAQNGMVNQINKLKRMLNDSRLSPGDRPAIESELSEASKLLDYSEQWVPRH